MNTISALSLLLLPLAAFAAWTATPAAASAPVSASGTMQVTQLEPIETTQAGGTTITTFALRLAHDGDFAGVHEGVLRLVQTPTGDGAVKDEGTFTGTVLGVPGTLNVSITGSLVDGVISGQFVILAGSGGLEDLRGQGTFEINAATGAGTYEGSLHFDPS